MKVEKGPLDGLLIITPKVFEDDRGFFFESFNADRFREAAGIVLVWRQDNHVRSVRNTVRGLHFQRPPGQAKLIRCIRGRIWDAVVDIRPGSPTLGRWFGVELSEENRKMLFVPIGFAHGYAVLSETAECLYKCSNVYKAELEDGFRWDDPEVGVPWPVKEPILSERDQTAKSFKEYLESA
jgi:dTDP-4-dehydrorhamnose 3,5-epimerase